MLTNQPQIDVFSECEISEELLSEGSSSNKVRDFAPHEKIESSRIAIKSTCTLLVPPEKSIRMKGGKSLSSTRLHFDNIDNETLSKQDMAEFTSLRGIPVKDEIMKTLKELVKKRKDSANDTCKSVNVEQIPFFIKENE
jgi:hypothetical protein